MQLWLRLLGISGLVALSVQAMDFARPFGRCMVLPRGKPIPVWGHGTPGGEVKVTFAAQTKTARCDGDGRWRVVLAAELACAQGRDLSLSAADGHLVLTDVLVGDVWLCSGQSNMDFPLAKAIGGLAESAAADAFPQIRVLDLSGAPTTARPYDAATLARLTEQDHFTGTWAPASAASTAGFSAIAWWTAKMLHLQQHIPIGVVENAVGGSGTEAWLPRQVLEAHSEYKDLLGDGWLDCPQLSPWARGRARLNLGTHLRAMHPFRPAFLFESGVRPWADFPFAGVLWYQGETNAELAADSWNESLLENMVQGWRSALNQPHLAFFMVQLPRIGGNDPLRAHWPEYRAMQARVAECIPGVHLIVTQDLGWDSPDVHPPDKLPVAKRLAAAVLQAASAPSP